MSHFKFLLRYHCTPGTNICIIYLLLRNKPPQYAVASNNNLYFSQCWGSALDRLLASPGFPHLHSAGCQANPEHVRQLVYLPTWFFISGFFVAW